MTELGIPAEKILAVNSDGVTAPPHLTYAEFLDWTDEDTLAEWVNGEVEMTSPATYKHQDITGFLNSFVRSYVEAFDLGVVLPPPFQMKLPYGGAGREPDLLFLAKAHLQRLEDVYIDGPADLAVEVVSKESSKRDIQTKFKEYAQGGVAEYWLINPLKNEAKFYQLDAYHVYQPAVLDSEGKYFSQVIPGFWLREAWLWQAPLPNLEKVLQEVGGAAYIQYTLRTGGDEHARQLIEQLKKGGYL